jgi:hypothetical protein
MIAFLSVLFPILALASESKESRTNSLDQKFAPKSMPVRLGQKSPWKFKWTPMSEEWKTHFDSIAKMHEGQTGAMNDEFYRTYAPLRRQLIKGLVDFGGDRAAVATWEEDLDAIMKRGQQDVDLG